jgi:hypothetical protein
MRDLGNNIWDISERLYPPDAIDAGDLHGALCAFAAREMLDYACHGQRMHFDGWICGFGVTLWLMGDTDGAGKVWSRACDEASRGKFKYSSTGIFQPGLLLWFASVWSKNEDWREEANALFDKLLKRRRPVMGARFSILLAKFLRREIDLSQVQSSYKAAPPQSQESYEIVSLFYAGVQAYDEGKVDETRRLWAQVKVKPKQTLVFEHYLLEHQRAKLGLGG